MATLFDYTIPGSSPARVRPALVIVESNGNRRVETSPGSGEFTLIPQAMVMLFLASNDPQMSGLNGEMSYTPLVNIDKVLAFPEVPEVQPSVLPQFLSDADAKEEAEIKPSSFSGKSKG